MKVPSPGTHTPYRKNKLLSSLKDFNRICYSSSVLWRCRSIPSQKFIDKNWSSLMLLQGNCSINTIPGRLSVLEPQQDYEARTPRQKITFHCTCTMKPIRTNNDKILTFWSAICFSMNFETLSHTLTISKHQKKIQSFKARLVKTIQATKDKQ